VIVDAADEATWVNDGRSDVEMGKFFRPYRSDLLRRDEISSLANSVKNDSPGILILI
jgi:hypothetical protein